MENTRNMERKKEMEEEKEWFLVEDEDLSKGRALEKISNLYAFRVFLSY